MVGEETYCFLVSILGYKLRRECQKAMKRLGICKVYVEWQERRLEISARG